MSEVWMVTCDNELDAGFGYDSGPFTVKAYAKHMNKVTPDFVTYTAEPEPEHKTQGVYSE